MKRVVIGLTLLVGTLGAQWQPDFRLTDVPGMQVTCLNYAWAIAADPSGNIHVVWWDGRDAPDPYYRWWVIANQTWDYESNLDEYAVLPSWEVGAPALASDPFGNIHVVWSDLRIGEPQIYYKYREGATGIWKGEEWITSLPGTAEAPSIATDPSSGDVHVIWWDRSTAHPQVFHKVKRASTGIWEGESQVSDAGHDCSWYSLAVDHSGNVHVVWVDSRLTPQIYHRRRVGALWDPIQQLTNATNERNFVSIATDNAGNLHLVWTDWRDRNIPQIFYKRRDASGNWDPTDTKLTDANGNRGFPSVAVDPSGNVHVVWIDQRTSPPQLYYKRWNATTSHWEPELELTSASGDRSCASLTCDAAGNIHIVWADFRDGNWEIYYKKYKTAVSIEESPSPKGFRFRAITCGHGAQIEYEIPVKSLISLAIYDINGRLVKTLVNREESVGLKSIYWKGRDQTGRRVSNGIYLCIMKGENFSATQKLVFLTR